MKIINKIVVFASVAIAVTSCSKKLDVTPNDQITSVNVYSSAAGYKNVLAKVYAAMATTGSQGAGSGDVAGIDPGTSDFLRLYWKAQELSTDEAVVAWGDAGIQDFHLMNWTSSNPMLTGLYFRCMYQITIANEFLRQSTDAKLAANGITGTDADEVRKYRYEARFLRAYQYYNLMDLFGNPPFITEAQELGVLPVQKTSAEMYAWLETEIKDILPKMYAARTNEYGRADAGAANALLARMYLNAKTYTGTSHYDSAAVYAQKVINSGYSLISNYADLMRADNNTNTAENIFTINYDGKRTQNYGGTTFLTHAPVGGSMTAADFGINGGWYGLRTTRSIVDLYGALQFNSDTRGQFYTAGQNLDIASLTTFTDGIAVTKYKNKTKAGVDGSDQTFADIDMPIFRLAEMYLIYAEAAVNGKASTATAVSYINLLRERAFGNTSGNITATDLTAQFIMDERAKELFWEGFRRTDLVRWNKFTTANYLWQWKGGTKDGTAVGSYRNIYPIPLKDLATNPNLKQNTDY